MANNKDSIIQLITDKASEWNSYDYISITNGLDYSEYRRRLEKLVQFPQEVKNAGYVESVVGKIKDKTNKTLDRFGLVQLSELYLNGIRENSMENYVRDMMTLHGIDMNNLKVVQYARDVYLSAVSDTPERAIDTSPLVQLISSNEEEQVQQITEPLNHLVNDTQTVYDSSDIQTGEPSDPLVHLTPELDYTEYYPDTVNIAEKAIQDGLELKEVFPQSPYEERGEVSYIPNMPDTTPVENTEANQERVIERKNEQIEYRKLVDQKKTERLRETVLNSVKDLEGDGKEIPGRALTIPDHWRGRIMDNDLHLYRDSKLLENQHGNWVEVKQTDPVRGPRRRVYQYSTDPRNPDYQYLNTAETATRRTDDPTFNPGYRGTVEDQFDNDDNMFTAHQFADIDKGRVQSDGQLKFQGGHTPLYLESEHKKKNIQDRPDGLLRQEEEDFNTKKKMSNNATQKDDKLANRPLSVMDPFTRVGHRDDIHKDNILQIPQYANAFSYNRTRIPIAEIEWRKGFRYLFITRPECYIMTNGQSLSSQCMNDETFYTSWTRLPHISYLLSPSYVTCQDPSAWFYRDNFNYLLTNRVMNMSAVGTEMEQLQSIQKSTVGATVTPGTIIMNDFGGSLNLTFRDTKNLEIYECLRLWMRYITNIYDGTFAPSFNNYSYYNKYGDLIKGDASIDGTSNFKYQSNIIHPYDRALDYCATIFDIVTDETGSKIVYWCKYIGVYPMSATQSGLTDNMNKALDNEQTVSSRFYYQGKEEYKMKSLVEFNYNAGILDSLGHPTDNGKRTVSHPYLIRQSTNPDQRGYVDPDVRKMDYIGAAGMFTGKPYVVLREGQNRLFPNGKIKNVFIPQLRFSTIPDSEIYGINSRMNGDIVNYQANTNARVAQIT